MPEEQKWPYFGPFEVVVHNNPEDCWVSLLGKVLDITPLIKQYERSPLIKPLLAMAGKDISHWFDEKTGDVRYHIHPITGIRVPYCPHGRFPDVQEQVPATSWRPLDRLPWWNDPKYQKGLLSKKVRPLKIVNTICCKEAIINVCEEETFYEIQDRFKSFCKGIEAYTWKYNGELIRMNKTMAENGIPDESELFDQLGLPKTFYIPCVFVYFNDDMQSYEESDDEQEAEDEFIEALKRTECNVKQYINKF